MKRGLLPGGSLATSAEDVHRRLAPHAALRREDEETYLPWVLGQR